MTETNGSDQRREHLKALSLKEPVALFLNTKLIELTHGYARVTMRVRPEHLNFNGFIFGGIIMSIADQAFAYATNSVITPNIAVQFNIQFIDRADIGDELIAECRVVREGKRYCASDMKVYNQNNKLIATATGTTIPVPDNLTR